MLTMRGSRWWMMIQGDEYTAFSECDCIVQMYANVLFNVTLPLIK